MTVVLDTNAIIQMFGARSPFAPIKDAIVGGKLTAAISTGIWLEYEEVIVRYAGTGMWRGSRGFSISPSNSTATSAASNHRSSSASSPPIQMTTSLPIAPSRRRRISW